MDFHDIEFGDDFPNDKDNHAILTVLQNLAEQDVIAFVLPTQPLGEEWVIGTYDDDSSPTITKLDSAQAVAFVAGVGAMTRRISRQQGILPPVGGRR